MAPNDRVKQDSLVYQRQGDTTLLRPQSQPVDTFVKTAEPIKSSLYDVAQSLAQVKPSLDRFITEKMHEQAFSDARDAEAKGMVATAKTWDEAIQKGEVSAGQSPLYQRVFEETLGKVSGLNKAQATLWQDWVSPNNADRTTQDPEVIAKWFTERRVKFLEGQSDNWVKGFSPAFNQVQQQLTQRIISDNVKYIEQANHDALGQLFMERIQAGLASGQKPQAIAAQLADDALPQRFAGMQGKEINTIAANAIIAIAQRTGRTDVLQVGYSDRPDIKNPGASIKGVFTIPEFAMRADAASTAILSKANANESRAQLAEARAEKRAHKDMLGEMVEKRAADPAWEPDLLWKQRWVKSGGSIRMLRSEIDADARPPKIVDPGQLNRLASDYVDMVRGGQDASRAIEALANAGLPISQVLALHKENDKGADAIFRGRVYGVQDDTLKGMVDRLTKSLDAPAAQKMVGAARTELVQFALEQQRAMSVSGQPDIGKLESLIVAKSQELQERMIRANDPIPTDQPGKPKPGQKGADAKPTSNPNSVADAIPADRIVPANEAARGYAFPSATQEIVGGRTIIKTWEPPQGSVMDIREINLLRTNPLRTNNEGVALWRRFDEQYGAGASRFFVTNSETEINTFLSRQRAKRGAVQQETVDRARNSNVPTQVP